jgi:pyruvyl transferase EpsO
MNLQGIIHENLLPLIPVDSKSFIIVDPPDYPNIGDSAIFMGEMTFLKTHFPKASIHFVDHRSYASGQKYLLEQADCIFFQGGGNFGDLWKRHQKTRLKVMADFAHKPLIQFPQSIHFDSDESVKEIAEAISNCTNYSLLVRDKKSFAFAKEYFNCSLNLIPDMAFYLPKLTRLKPKSDVFCLLREDKEQLVDKTQEIIDLLTKKSLSHSYEDWVVERAPTISKINVWLCDLIKRYPSQTKRIQPIYERLRLHYAQTNIKRGVVLLSQGEVVVTDRLHAFIMSTLLGITNYTFDSFGGKISSFHKAWMDESTTTHLLNEVDALNEYL